jgi:hypothetical protein
MADKAPVWDRIVAKHGLQPYPFDEVVSWGFADAIFGTEWDIARSTLKARRHGFDGFIETDRMFTELLTDLGHDRVIPTLTGVPR